MADHTDDHKKHVAVIVPRWCIDMLIDQLDMQYDALRQELDFYNKTGDAASYKDLKDELNLYGSAIMQIDGQLKD